MINEPCPFLGSSKDLTEDTLAGRCYLLDNKPKPVLCQGNIECCEYPNIREKEERENRAVKEDGTLEEEDGRFKTLTELFGVDGAYEGFWKG